MLFIYLPFVKCILFFDVSPGGNSADKPLAKRGQRWQPGANVRPLLIGRSFKTGTKGSASASWTPTNGEREEISWRFQTRCENRYIPSEIRSKGSTV